MRCDYCYNRDIVLGKGILSLHDALTWLRQRQKLLDGIVLSGGEATQYPHLVAFAHAIKTLGFKIKLDTNGTHPACIAALLEQHLIDYVALDYKAPEYKYEAITHYKAMVPFHQSLELLISANVPFEVRTTLHADLLDEDDINAIIKDLHVKGYCGTYYLQHFLYDEHTIGRLTHPKRQFDKSRLHQILPIQYRN